MKYLILCFTLVAQTCLGLETYHVGNSLTSDSVGSAQFYAEQIAELSGVDWTIGAHIDGGQSLHSIWTNPDGVNTGKPGPWDEVLPFVEFDAVTFQLHNSGGAHYQQDRDRLNDFISTVIGSPVIYITATWPHRDDWSGDTFADYWTDVSPISGPTERRRIYWESILTDVRADNPERTIYLVPQGEVLYNVELALGSAEFLLEDNQHMDRRVGRWLMGQSLFSTLHHVSPLISGYATDYDNQPTGTTPTPELVDQLNYIVWDTLSSYEHSGYYDFNADYVIDGTDLGALLAQWGNGVDALDLGRLLSQMTEAPALLSYEMPEPASWVLFCIGLAMMAYSLR